MAAFTNHAYRCMERLTPQEVKRLDEQDKRIGRGVMVCGAVVLPVVACGAVYVLHAQDDAPGVARLIAGAFKIVFALFR